MHDGRVGLEGAAVVDDRFLDLDVDHHELQRVLGEVAGPGDDHDDRLAHEPDDAVGEEAERPVAGVVELLFHPVVEHLRVEVGGGVHRDHAGQLAGRADVDRHDPAPRDVAAGEGGVEHPWDGDVVDVAPVAGEEPGVLRAGDPLAHEAVAGGGLGCLGHAWSPSVPKRAAA